MHSARPRKVISRIASLHFVSYVISGVVGMVGIVDLSLSVGLVYMFGCVDLTRLFIWLVVWMLCLQFGG